MLYLGSIGHKWERWELMVKKAEAVRQTLYFSAFISSPREWESWCLYRREQTVPIAILTKMH